MSRLSINYKHLHYFWIVAREGSIAKASSVLHLTPQTISGQLTLLEESLKTRLFRKQGRNLALTESGQLVFRYATDIFHLGEELEDLLQNKQSDRRQRLVVGILDSIPKSIAYRILAPVLKRSKDVALSCLEGNLEQLVSQLAINSVDLVLSDAPFSSNFNIKTHAHLLGESPLAFFASPQQAVQMQRTFPGCLNGAPMLMPTDHSASGRAVREWLRDNELHPRIKGYFDDSALLKAFGKAGEGVFVMPAVIEKDIIKEFNVRRIGTVDELTERYYAITAQRRIHHPVVTTILNTARDRLFPHHD